MKRCRENESGVGMSPSLGCTTDQHRCREAELDSGKEFFDTIHSSMELHPCLVEIIDTKQYQRLRGLSQLGLTKYVFPCATHTRFEHSIGVSYLGTLLVKHLQRKQPILNISESDVLCISIAGLCHDLGHGPFSHLFDGEFMKGRDWKHERGSVLMLRYLLQDNLINLEKYGLCDRDVLFIEEIIMGSNHKKLGRDSPKCFLYDIINNERSGLDTDKLDYIIRDAYFAGVQISIGTTVDRIINMSRVLPDEKGTLSICYPEKDVHTLFGVFHARVHLHTTVYQHKVVKACELMVRDILTDADEFLSFKSRITGESFKMSESVTDMSVFCQLKDSILDIIDASEDPRLEKSRALLDRFLKRDIYKCCGKVELQNQRVTDQSVANRLLEISKAQGTPLTSDDFIVEVMVVHHGAGSRNPVDGLRFYVKNECDISIDRCFQISRDKYAGALLPQQMNMHGVRVYATNNSVVDVVKESFVQWTKLALVNSPLCSNMSQKSKGTPESQRSRGSPACMKRLVLDN